MQGTAQARHGASVDGPDRYDTVRLIVSRLSADGPARHGPPRLAPAARADSRPPARTGHTAARPRRPCLYPAPDAPAAPPRPPDRAATSLPRPAASPRQPPSLPGSSPPRLAAPSPGRSAPAPPPLPARPARRAATVPGSTQHGTISHGPYRGPRLQHADRHNMIRLLSRVYRTVP
ncbi:vegetative cell wall protein gp1-like [Phragmites australis]|uniref:vegetative cell wall protein gp1-like n=1 Tax=Phragmites australis TaxID=29695 RepID=UPI002D791599|nr:vegetative cell wall protein gp1-like [Phragmites australis]